MNKLSSVLVMDLTMTLSACGFTPEALMLSDAAVREYPDSALRCPELAMSYYLRGNRQFRHPLRTISVTRCEND